VTNFVGQVVNGFEIQKLIGQGKFSFVFRAKRISDGVLVALKLIKVSASRVTWWQIFDMENEKQRDNCLKEVQLHQVTTADSLFAEPFLVARPPKHRQVPQLVHRHKAERTLHRSRVGRKGRPQAPHQEGQRRGNSV
jgi:serine/threonine protein kinase